MMNKDQQRNLLRTADAIGDHLAWAWNYVATLRALQKHARSRPKLIEKHNHFFSTVMFAMWDALFLKLSHCSDKNPRSAPRSQNRSRFCYDLPRGARSRTGGMRLSRTGHSRPTADSSLKTTNAHWTKSRSSYQDTNGFCTHLHSLSSTLDSGLGIMARERTGE